MLAPLMRAVGFAVLSIVLATLGAGASARAADKVALLIGNSAYSTANPLRNPVNDVQHMAKLLGGFGFDATVLEDLDYRSFGRALLGFREKAEAADTAIFFYSGHGMEIDGRNYLVPTDAELRTPGAEQIEAIDLSLVIDSVGRASRLSVIIVDACRQGAPGPRNTARGFAPVAAPSPGLAVAFSTSPGTVAWDGEGELSPYTRALSEMLSQDPGLDVRLLFTSLGESTTRYAGAAQEPMGRFGRFSREAVPIVPGGKPPTKAPAALRFDGMYGAGLDDYTKYLRFFENGDVISISDTASAEKVAVWFDRAHPLVGKGSYSLFGDRIFLTQTSSQGTVNYQGRVLDGKLELESHSLINQNRAARHYEFMPIRFGGN